MPNIKKKSKNKPKVKKVVRKPPTKLTQTIQDRHIVKDLSIAIPKYIKSKTMPIIANIKGFFGSFGNKMMILAILSFLGLGMMTYQYFLKTQQIKLIYEN